MNNELEQQAIETFAAVPEIYQQAFRDAGADFPDELVAEIKKDPNQAVNLVNSDKNLKSAVINVFKSNKDAILKYMQQATSMFKHGGKFDYLSKLQQGGQLTRRQAFEESQKNKGYNKSQVRLAYRNARNAGLDKQAALAAIIGQPQETEVVERPALIDNITAPAVRLTTQSETISTRPTTNYDNFDFGIFSFNDAFGRARKAGLNEFTWNGKRYTTELAPNTTIESEPKQQPSLIVRKLQEAIAPIVEDQRWINEHRPYWADLKRQGGKLEQENNIRKDYIKDSKKAAKESSEKMKKISKDYDKKLEKVQKNQRGGSVESGYSYDYPGKETIVSGPVRMTLTTVPSRGNAMEDSTFTYFGPNNESVELHRIYDNNNVFPKTFNKYGSQHESNWEGLRNKWEELKKFYIEHPEFNNRKSYTQY